MKEARPATPAVVTGLHDVPTTAYPAHDNYACRPCWQRGDVVSTSNSSLEDVRIGVRLKVSALWIALLFLYAYGDIFGFFRTGLIKEVMAGSVSGIQITQAFLFGVSVYIAIASAMVFLSLVLRPRINRWTNIVLPILYIASIVASSLGETWAYYYFLSAAESALLLLIVWYAWTWPRREADLASTFQQGR